MWIIILAAGSGMLYSTTMVARNGLIAIGKSPRKANRLAVGVLGSLSAWLIISSSAAGWGLYKQSERGAIPWVAVSLTAALAVMLFFASIKPFGELAGVKVASGLITPQMYRVVGVVFLILFAVNELPPVLAISAGVGDLAIGVYAPIVAKKVASGESTGRLFNTLGLLDLLNVTIITYTLSPGPLTPFQSAPDASAMAVLPMSILTTVAVPLAATLHIKSIRAVRLGD
ncbi:hypothetical protein [Streptomyces collinus]|uniref:hypothetical protein n=1 Tax=Streptomyces collinus TaxID=42684 RepID=UPI0036E7C109